MRGTFLAPFAFICATFVAAPALSQCGVRTWLQGPDVPALYGHAIAFDSLRNRVISFGGWGEAEGQFLQQTWSFDGVTWTRLQTPTSPPGSMFSQNLAYDSGRDRIVKYAGSQQSPTRETWEFDGNNWTLKDTQGTTAREGFAMVFDAARQRTVLFGGHNQVSEVNETWLWDGTTWTLTTPLNSPPARVDAHIAYDSARQRVVLYGGLMGSHTILNDLWEWDGTNWAQVVLPNGPPNAVAGGMAFDSIRSHIHLSGNTILGIEDWIYNGETWTQLSLPPNLVCGVNAANKAIVFMPGIDKVFFTYPTVNPAFSQSRSYVFGNISAPVCFVPPADDFVRPGGIIELGARFTCTPGTTYRWYHNGQPLSDITSGASGIVGSASHNLTLYGSFVTAARAGEYWCVASSPCGNVSSPRANITITCDPVDFDFICGPSDATFTLDTPLGSVNIPVSLLGTLRLRFSPNCGQDEHTLSIVSMDMRTEPAVVQVPLAFGGSLTMNNARLLLDATHGDPGIAAMPTNLDPWSRRFDQQEVEPNFTGLLNYNLLGIQGNYNLTTLPPTLINWTGDVSRLGVQTISLPFSGSWTIPTGVGDDLTLSMETWLTGVLAAPCAPDLGATGGVAGADGQLDNNDFIVFINYFFAADATADMGRVGGEPGSDGLFDNNDFIAYIDAFFTGCV